MSTYQSPPMRDGYEALKTWFENRKVRSNQDPNQVLVGHNTWLRRQIQEDDLPHFVLQYHRTDVVEWTPYQTMCLNTGGWLALTTKERINSALPHTHGEHLSYWTLVQEKGAWWLVHSDALRVPDDDLKGYHYESKTYQEYPYADGMVIHLDTGEVEGAGPDSTKLRRRVNQYILGYMQAFRNYEVPAPSDGDCWMCSLFPDGDKGTPPDEGHHLIMHMNEKYYVPSLLARAMREHPQKLSIMAQSYVHSRWDPYMRETQEMRDFPVLDLVERQLKGCLRSYMSRELGLAV